MVIMIYRIIRAWYVVMGTFYNKIKMRCYGVRYGACFRSCGSILFRNYAGKDGIVIGNNVSVNSHRIANPIGGDIKTTLVAGNRGGILIHDGVSMSNATIYASESIEIGEGTCMGGGCKIYDTDFHSTNPEWRMNGNVNVPSAPIKIGKCVFIGGHSIILKGVSIGDEAVIGAGSVVTRNIPAGEIWAGIPAKYIKKIER